MSISLDYKLKNILPGSICFVWGRSLIARIIMWYQKWETGYENTPAHVEIYFGSGKHETIGAEPEGVRVKSLLRHKRTRVEVYSYINMSVEQLQRLEDYARGSVGRIYDYAGLVHFLGNLVRKRLPQWKFANFCSELVAEAFKRIGIDIVPGLKPSEQTPARQWQACKDNPEKWKLVLSWGNSSK